MKKQGERVLILVLSFTMIVAGLNYFAYASETDQVESALSFACEGYAEPELGGDIPSKLQLTTDDKKYGSVFCGGYCAVVEERKRCRVEG